MRQLEVGIDDAEIREFLRTQYPRIVGAVSLVTADEGLAEDAVQEAVIRAWERTARGEEIGSLGPWIATVALNLSRSHLRRMAVERRSRRLATTASSPDFSEPDVSLDVHAAIRQLPLRQRKAVILRYVLGYSTAEAADAMATSEGTVKSQLAKARVKLARSLALSPDEEDDHVETR